MVEIKKRKVLCAHWRFVSGYLTSIGTLSQKASEDSNTFDLGYNVLFILLQKQKKCLLEPFVTLWKKRSATLQLIDDGIKEIYRSETACWPKFLWYCMYFSQSKPKFATNFIIKCCVSSKDRFLSSTEVTWKVMLLQKKPKSSPKNSSSSQFLLVNYIKSDWFWSFATCFVPGFKFPPPFCNSRSWNHVLQVFWTN